MLRAVSQMVTRSAAATRTIALATSIQSRQAVHTSAPVMLVLAPRALVEVVVPVARPIDTPEAVLLAGRPPGLLGAHPLPLRVEELDRSVRQRLRRHVSPAARHLVQDVPAMLAVGLAVGEPAEPPDHAAHAARGERRHDGARRGLVERAELVGETRHRAPDAHAAGFHAAAHVIDGPARHDVAVDDRPPAADLD